MQRNLFTTGAGSVAQQRKSNEIATLSPELVQAGTNMAKIEFERKEAEERKLDAVRDMVEAQQEDMRQQALDNMEWSGDKNEVWSFGGKQGTRESWYKAAKTTKAQLPKIAEENNWDDAKRRREQKLLEDFMEATKERDFKRAAEIRAQMDPETQKRMDRNNEYEMHSSQSAPANLAQKSAVSTQVTSAASSQDDYILRMSNADSAAAKPVDSQLSKTAESVDTGLAKNPPMELTSTFSVVATPAKPAQAAEVEQFASAEVEAPMGKLGGLTSGFSIPQRNA